MSFPLFFSLFICYSPFALAVRNGVFEVIILLVPYSHTHADISNTRPAVRCSSMEDISYKLPSIQSQAIILVSIATRTRSLCLTWLSTMPIKGSFVHINIKPTAGIVMHAYIKPIAGIVMHAYMHTRMHAYMHTRTHVCMHTRMHAWIASTIVNQMLVLCQ